MRLPRRFPQYSLLTAYFAWQVAVWGHGFTHTCPPAFDRCREKTNSASGVAVGCDDPYNDPVQHHHRHDADRCLICQSARVSYTVTASPTVSLAPVPRGVDVEIAPRELIGTPDPSPILIRGPPDIVTI